jgi:hypothetical protein
MFQTGPGNASFLHTGAGRLTIDSAGIGVRVQGVDFDFGGINLPPASGVGIGGIQILNASGLYLSDLFVAEMGHLRVVDPNVPIPPFGIGHARLEFSPTVLASSLGERIAGDGGLHLELPGGLWFNSVDDNPNTPTNEGKGGVINVLNGIAFLSGYTGLPDTQYTPEDDSVSGVVLPAGGGAWDTLSDARRKTDWEKADPEAFLRGITGMNIQSWRYKTQSDAIRHVGPTAQEFRAAFGLGTNDTTISTVDADGASMLAIQALAKRTDELKAATARIIELEKRLADIESLLREMKVRQ